MRKCLAALLAALMALGGFALSEELGVGVRATDDLSHAIEIAEIRRAEDGLEIALNVQNLDIEALDLSALDFRLTYGDTQFLPGTPSQGEILPLEEVPVALSYAVPEAAFSGDFGVFLFLVALPGGREYAVDVLSALGLAEEGAPMAALDGFVPLGDFSVALGDIAVAPVDGRDTLKRIVLNVFIRNDADADVEISDLIARLSYRERYVFEPVEAIDMPALAPGNEIELRMAFDVANAVVDSGEAVELTLALGESAVALGFVPTADLPDADAPIVIEAGYRHSFARAADGTLWAWGSGEYGRLGTGSAQNAYDPEVVELEGVAQVSAGYYHSLFLTADGGVWGAGCNYDYGQLGDGTGANHMSPVRIMDGAKRVLAGADYSAALLSDGTLWTWGRNEVGQLGLGDEDTHVTPEMVALDGVADIVGGEKFLLALLEDGRVFGWGANPYGQLPDVDEMSSAPVDLGFSDVRAIAAGNNHAVALTAAGELLLWGDDAYGQIGAAPEFSWPSPIVAVEAGGDISAVRLEDGSWWAWGDLFGAEPSKLANPAPETVSIGYWHILAAEKSGALWGFGSNDYSQITGSYEDTHRNWIRVSFDIHDAEPPSDAPKDRDKAAASEPFMAGAEPVGAGYYTSFATDAQGGIWAWGRSDYGQLGTGDGDRFDEPTKVEGLEGVKQVSTGDYHTLFVTEDGDLYGAGCSEDYNQLGNGTYENEDEPVFIMEGVARAWAGRDISAALLADGTLLTWGANGEGELGHGHADADDAPAPVALSGIVDVAVGKRFMAALLDDGTLWTWGSNEYGQLGLGASFETGVPQRVEDIPNVVSIAAGSAHMAALDVDGNIWTWGAAVYGQLGTGDTSNQPKPIRVRGVENCAAVYAGGDSTGARLIGGAVKLWGAYFSSTPGEERISYYNEARYEREYMDIAGISMGDFHIIATDADGNVYTLGDNDHGQLGIGDGADNSYGYYYYSAWNSIGLNLSDADYKKPESTPNPNSGHSALSA